MEPGRILLIKTKREKTYLGYWWVYWPIIGWGIFVVIHGFNVSRIGKSWEDKKIKEIMEKEK